MMTQHLPEQSVHWAIQHLHKYGDTDIFRRPFELIFFVDKVDEISDAVSSMPLQNYQIQSALEYLSLKSELGFRIAHQIYPADALLLTAAIHSIGSDIENYRIPETENAVFAYRFQPTDDYQMFKQENSYHNWIQNQYKQVKNDMKIQWIIKTDIADFYQRIYSHRLDNILRSSPYKKKIVNFVLKIIKAVRAKQSHGLPVGGNASRLLAELTLTDIDSLILEEGYSYTRFVDDFRIYLHKRSDAFHILPELAEKLSVNEGLALNASKTQIIKRDKFLRALAKEKSDILEEKDHKAIYQARQHIYADEQMPDELLKALRSQPLLDHLRRALQKTNIDFGQVRVLLRALRYALPDDTFSFVQQNFNKLSMFPKELLLLLDDMYPDGKCDDLHLKIWSEIHHGNLGKLPLFRTWWLEFYVRRLIDLNRSSVRCLDKFDDTLTRRQVLLLKGLANDTNYFRRRKTGLDEFNRWEQPAFILGASCLPADEYHAWISAIKGRCNFPFADEFCKWAREKNIFSVYPERRMDISDII